MSTSKGLCVCMWKSASCTHCLWYGDDDDDDDVFYLFLQKQKLGAKLHVPIGRYELYVP